MKKSRILACALIVAVMVMGAGYASWTSGLNINNTVTTGTFGVAFDNIDSGISIYKNGDPKYLKPIMSIPNDYQMDISIDNMYPGTEVSINAQMKNIGTIPAIFDNAVVVFDNTNDSKLDLKSALKVPLLFGTVYDANGNKLKDLSTLPTFDLKDMESNINALLKDVKLEPGQYIALNTDNAEGGEVRQHFNIQFPMGTKGDNTTQNKQVKFSIKMNWKQVNETR